MKKTLFVYLASAVALLASFVPAVALADLQCYSSTRSFVNVQNANQCFSNDGSNNYLLDTGSNTWTNSRGQTVSSFGATAGGCPIINGTQTTPGGIGVMSDKCVDQDTGALYNYAGQRIDLGGSSVNTTPVTPATPASPASPSGPAPAGGGRLQYTPLEPLNNAPATTYNSLGAYLGLVFNILLSIGGMIAVVTLVLGGVTYMVSEIVDKKSEARRRMQAALIGLFLLLTCWLILHEINPNLTQFKLPGIDNPPAAPPGTTYEANKAPSTASSINQNNIQNCETSGGSPTGKHIVFNDAGATCQ